MTPIQRLILDRMAELDISYRDAAKKSRGLVSHTTINHIALGRRAVRRVDDDTVTGLARALDVSETEVRAAFQESMTQPAEFRLPADAALLGPKERAAVLAMVDAFLAKDRGEG